LNPFLCCITLFASIPFSSHLPFSLQEIANANEVESILENGVTHDSPFGLKVFELIFDGHTSHEYDDPTHRDHFWKSCIATSALHYLNQERNNLALFVRTSVELSLPDRPTETSELTTLLSALRGDDASFSPDMEMVDPYILAAAELYSAAFFGRVDQDAWIKRILPIVASVTKYRSGNTTPISKKKKSSFWVAVDDIYRDLDGTTVSTHLHVVEESLIRLMVVRHLLSSVFKNHHDVLISLIKNRAGIPPFEDDGSEAPLGDDAVKKHFIAPLSSKDKSKYTNADIAFFKCLRDNIKSCDRKEDKKRLSSDAESRFILSFVAPAEADSTSVSTSAPPAKKRRKGGLSAAAKLASAMDLLSDSSDDSGD
jgi:hypothetical protein